jgi:hypothetical protein
MSVRTTVVIPTHDHGETLRYAISSVQAQTVQDFEILIVGDGVPDITRRVVGELMRNDPRIRFFDFPKGARYGEEHRHAALASAKGEYICYLCDDDLWLPSHLSEMQELLNFADLACSADISISPTGELVCSAFDLNDALDRDLLRQGITGFSLASGAHTLSAYRRLPYGWRPTPAGTHIDTFMWQQFIAQPWCRTLSSARPTVLRFEAKRWDDQSREVRLGGLAYWLTQVSRPGGEAEFAWRAFESTWFQTPHPAASRRANVIRTKHGYPSLKFGDRIHLSSPGACAYLSWGWSFQEDWGVWSDGEEARLAFSFPTAPPKLLRLDICFDPLRVDRARREVEIFVNGGRVATWDVSGGPIPQVRALRFPGSPWLDIRFTIPHAAPLRQLAKTDDHRRLGIGLRWFEINPDRSE